MNIIILAIFSYALYRITEVNNITPWKWIVRYWVTFTVTTSIVLGIILISMYGETIVKNAEATEKIIPSLEKLIISMEPFIVLYQIVLFFFFRTRIIRYVHALDQIDKNDNNPHLPDPPRKEPKDKGEQKDFSYFR